MLNQAEKIEKASGWLASRYQVLRLIARGGMSAVYLAFDTLTKKQVAVKILIGQLDQPEQYLPRFRREARAMAQLTHPHIVKVLDYGELENRPFLVLEYMSGGTLKDKMGSPIPYRAAAQLLLPIARALVYAHQQGFVHRDVKPANILLSETGHPLLSDFGIAKSPLQDAPNGLTGAGVGIGTPEYMAPEQALGEGVDARADIYSLGVVLYELITGQKPFIADSQVAILLKQAQETLPRPRLVVPDLPEDVERMLFHVLAKNPADRFQTMQEFANALEKIFLGDRLSPAEAPPIPIPASKPPQVFTLPVKLGRSFSFGLIGGVLVLAAILGVVLINAGRSAAANSPKRYVYISEIQGDVSFNEAGKDLPVSTKGDMVSITPQTGLKTLDGHIRLGTTDGSTIILDTQSAIQFGSPGSASDKTGTFFDHLYGRSLLINGQKTPGQGGIRFPNGFSVNVAQSIVGIEFHPENSDPLEVDCLVGSCQVITQKQSTVIMGGEHVRIAGDGTIHPVDQARFSLWAALGGGDIPLPPTATATLTALPTQTAVVKSATPTPSQTASASPTLTASPTASSTASQTPTLTPTWRYIPPTKTKSPTNTPERPPEIVPTDPPPATNTAPPPPPPPPTDVPAPTIAPFPTYTPIPAPTVTPGEPPTPPPGG